MAYDTKIIANALLDIADMKGLTVTPMQLQKLLYFSHGWHMEMNDGAPLLDDEFQAWDFGPVSTAAYHEFKKFGSKPISGKAINPFTGTALKSDIGDKITKFLEQIVDIYGRLTGPQMSYLTHKPGTPWSETFRGGIGRNDVIDGKLIFGEFQKLRQGA